MSSDEGVLLLLWKDCDFQWILRFFNLNVSISDNKLNVEKEHPPTENVHETSSMKKGVCSWK